MLSSGQVSDLLNVSPATLRNWTKWFGASLSESATRGRGRKYSPVDVAVLKEAQTLLQTGMRWKQVAARLQVVEEQQEEPITDLALLMPKEYQRLMDSYR